MYRESREGFSPQPSPSPLVRFEAELAAGRLTEADRHLFDLFSAAQHGFLMGVIRGVDLAALAGQIRPELMTVFREPEGAS